MNAQSVDAEHSGLPIFFISLTEEHQGLPIDPDNFWTFGGILCDSCPVFVNLLAEGGGIEPPTPYRVYGLAIRCITALPSLRIVCRPRRPQRRLPGRLLECGDFGLSMRGALCLWPAPALCLAPGLQLYRGFVATGLNRPETSRQFGRHCRGGFQTLPYVLGFGTGSQSEAVVLACTSAGPAAYCGGGGI